MIVRILLSASMVAGLACTLTASGVRAAQSDTAQCRLYGNFGASVASFMLPLRMQDVLDMATGDNPDLARELGESIDSALTDDEMATLEDMDPETAALLGELAGQMAFQHLLSARATSPDDLAALMTEECNERGVDALIDSLRRAKAAFR